MPAGIRLEETPGQVPDPVPDAKLSPRARRVAKTRRAIIEAARALIDEQGYAHTTIDQIADRADIAPRTFFRYFPSKEALVFAEFDELRQAIWPMLDLRPDSEPPLRSLVAVLADYADLVEADHERLAWGFRIAQEHESLTFAVTELKVDTVERLTAFLASRLGVDPEADPRPNGWAVATMGLFSASMSTVFKPGPPTDRTAREVFLELVGETGVALKSARPK